MALEKQMELFEEGGLMQEGGTVDEESGNDVPTGSLKKEVRDDIPAQLSEGEFVMPADVVRFHGLDKMMALRDEAKMGLQRMEDMGQMGNADEATIPDGVPFSMDDLDIEDEPVEMQVGGFVQPPVVGMPTPPPMPSQFVGRQPQYTPYQVPTYGGYQPPQPQTVPTAPTGLPSFSDFVTPKYELYVNDAGNTISIPVDANGNPLIPVPAGYRKMDEQAGTTPTTPDTGITPPTTTVSTGGDEPDGGGGPEPAGPKLDQFGREEDPRITQVTQNEQFAKLAKDVDPRGFLEKIKDDFLGAVGASTTSQEYQKALNELSVGIANYTANPDEQSRLIAEIRGNMGQPTRTELGMGLAPVVSGAEFDKQQQILKDQERMQQGQIPTTTPESVGVQTTQMLGDKEGATVTEAAKTEYKGIGTDPATGKIVEPYDFETATRILEQGLPEQMFAELSGGKTSLPVTRALADLRAQASGLYSNYDEGDVQVARSALKYFEEEGRIPKEDTSVDNVLRREPDQPSPADAATAQAEAGAIRESFPTRGESMQARVDVKAKDYERRGYGKSAAQSAARNKVQADDEAMNQTGDYSGKTTAVTDKYGNAVRSGSDGSVVTSGPEKQDDGPEPDSRWCCSQMVHRGLWTQQHEFARLTVWSSKQPDWWKSGYHVWGKVLAKTFLRKKGFWTDVMQSFYDYHIRKKPYTWRTAIAHVMVYPGVFICGNIWTKQPKGVTLASFKELNG